MADIIKVFNDPIPALRFIGKRYYEFGHWGEWFANGWFDEIEKAMGGMDAILKVWENGGGYVGLERRREGDPFEYWLGMFVPTKTPVPAGFQSIDFDAGHLGTCWLYGPEKEVHDTSRCRATLETQGIAITTYKEGAVWSFENCLCPRYTTPDEKGNIIMDYCYFTK